MPGYFDGVPNFDYIDRNPSSQNISDYLTVKNLFKRGKIRDEIFGKSDFFETYIIEGDERPDQVAYQVYDDETLDWVVLLSNNILNVNTEWPLTQYAFDRYLLEKYGSYENLYSGINHYITSEIKNSSNVAVLPAGIKLNSNQWKTNGPWIQTQNSKILEIYAGDGTTTSNVVTVVTYGSGITNLKVGDQITISNIKQEDYNGQHIITELVTVNQLNTEDYDVKVFSYELPSAPEVARPELSFVLNDDGIPVGSHLEEARALLSDSTLSGNAYYFEYFDNFSKVLNQVPAADFLTPITNYEYELENENNKREIYVLKRRYLNTLLEDVARYMPYKSGGDQFINPTLKRGDNIRLFE